MVAKAQRHHCIKRVLTAERLHSQSELLSRLARQGMVATQTTLSRDLAELGVVKGAGGYQLPTHTEVQPLDSAKSLGSTLARLMLEANVGGSLLVLHTPAGQAVPLALEIDRAAPAGMLGTIAGDDCVFVAATSSGRARSLATMFRNLATGGKSKQSPRSGAAAHVNR